MNDPSVALDALPPSFASTLAVPDALRILQGLEAIVWQADRETLAFTFVSQGAERLLGYPVEAWAEPGFWERHLHPEDRTWALAHRTETDRRAQDHVVEYRMQCADGRVVWVRDHVRFTRIPGNGGAISQGVMVDITAEKQAERQLREHRDLNTSVLDNVDALVAVLDADGIIRRVNRTCEITVGRAARSIVGRRFVERFCSDDELARVTGLFARLAAGKPRGRCETHTAHREGEVRTVSWAFTALRDESGMLTRMVATGMDLTERKRSEQALREREQELLHAQKMDALGRLAGGVAHDFNNVITAILGYSHVLALDLADRPKALEMAEGIREAAEHATRLTAQLRTLSRRHEASLAELDPAEELQNMREMLARLIGEDIALELDLVVTGDRVLGEPGQFTQLLLNLALNARDAMPQGGTLLVTLDRVRLAAEDAAARRLPLECLRLSVSDEGCGMDDSTRARIFEPFFTTKGHGGTGLGLSTVYAIVRAWGGDVSVESRPDEGTTFHLLLPRAIESGPAATAKARGTRRANAPTTPESPSPGGETILLAEDEPVVRRLMRETLRRHGYQVITASDGAQAIQRAGSHSGPIDLLVTDVVMPGMSGREAAETMVRERPGLRVLFVSGYSNDAMLRHGIAPEGMAFLEKPFAPEVLARRVRSLLDDAAVVR